MKHKKKQQLEREVKNFSLTGIAATAIDYAIFNLFTLLLHVPAVPSNVVSTTASSVASYKMNAKLVFEGRRYSKKVTITLFILITAIGIYIIQNLVLYALDHLIQAVSPDMSRVLRLNIAKIGASLVAGLWNYFMLRYYVFIPESKKHEIKAAE